MGQYSTYSNSGSSESILDTDGASKKMSVTNATSEQLLNAILLELKKINIHMSIVSDMVVRDSEVE